MARQKNHNEAAERALLGLVLVDVDLFWRFKDRLTTDLFFSNRHRQIISIMQKMADANRLFELSYIAGQFHDDDEGDSIEGYLFTIQNEAGARESAADLMDDLEELRARRQIIDLAQSLASGEFEPGVTARERITKAMKRAQVIQDGVGEQEQHISRYAERLVASAGDAYQRGETLGIRTGIAGLDDLFGPLLAGNVYMIAGASGSAKTAIALQAAVHMAQSYPGVFFSQEMRGTALAARHLGRMTGVTAQRINAASINAEDYELLDAAARSMADIPIYVNEQTGLNFHQIRNRCHRLKRLHGIGWGIVDHLLLMGATEKGEDRISRISNNLKGLKAAAKILDIPFIILGQLTNEFERIPWREIRRPNAGDCYGGAAVKQDVDGLVFVYRPEGMLVAKEPPSDKHADHVEWESKLDQARGYIDFTSGKYREGNPEGVKVATFDGPRMEVRNSPARKKRQDHLDDITPSML